MVNRSFRLRLLFEVPEKIRDDYTVPDKLLYGINLSNTSTISELSDGIRKSLNMPSKFKMQLFLDGFLISSNESILVLRDDELVNVRLYLAPGQKKRKSIINEIQSDATSSEVTSVKATSSVSAYKRKLEISQTNITDLIPQLNNCMPVAESTPKVNPVAERVHQKANNFRVTPQTSCQQLPALNQINGPPPVIRMEPIVNSVDTNIISNGMPHGMPQQPMVPLLRCTKTGDKQTNRSVIIQNAASKPTAKAVVDVRSSSGSSSSSDSSDEDKGPPPLKKVALPPKASVKKPIVPVRHKLKLIKSRNVGSSSSDSSDSDDDDITIYDIPKIEKVEEPTVEVQCGADLKKSQMKEDPSSNSNTSFRELLTWTPKRPIEEYPALQTSNFAAAKRIAYKVIELSEDCSPVVSEWKLAKVIQFHESMKSFELEQVWNPPTGETSHILLDNGLAYDENGQSSARAILLKEMIPISNMIDARIIDDN